MKRRSKAIVVLLLYLYNITLAGADCKGLFCYVDYIDTLTCNYAIDDDGADITLDSINVKWTFEEEDFEDCELIPSGARDEYICKIDMEDFSFDTKCTVLVNGNDTCGPFIIGDKFKPQAPFNLTTITISENYNVSWRTLYEMHTYRSNELAYELSYKKDAESWLNQKTIHIYEDETSLHLLGSQFTADEIYVARVRARPKNTSIYSGHWSSWSKPVSWRTPTNENTPKIWVYCAIVPFSVALVILLYVFKWPSCLWKTWVLIPSPAFFFKPLYMVHHGDFKSWLGSSYYHATPFDGMRFPEFFEVYTQGFLKNPSRQDIISLDKQKLLVTKPCPGDSDDCRKCDCNETVVNKDSGSVHIGTQHCAHIGDDLEAAMDESADDSYPCVNLDSDNSNILNLMLDHESGSQATPCSLNHCNFHLNEGLLRSKINILDLLTNSPEGWEFQDSPSQECDENVFYNDSYNALSPDSGDSADFGYPRICLDLDTIDSGFCDSECGSPVDSDFGNKGTSPEPLSSDSYSGEELYERNYVKQWVPNHSVITEFTTKKPIRVK